MSTPYPSLAATSLFAALFLVSVGFSQTTERVSVGFKGTESDHHSENPSISADGRFVAFASEAKNLVTGDLNRYWDVFVHDRQTHVTERVSVNSQGVEGNHWSYSPSISADGRFVAFESKARNFASWDSNSTDDIFVHDRQTGITERVSVDSLGWQADGSSQNPSISADGRYVAFESEARDLVPGDTNHDSDIFVHDRQTGLTERVSVDSNGEQSSGGSMYFGGSWDSSISADGRYVTFTSGATNLVPGDTNQTVDVFVHDRETGTTERSSLDSLGNQVGGGSFTPSISADGRYVAFSSTAASLVPGDLNRTNDIFIHDRQSGITERVSVDSLGVEGNGSSESPSISADGAYISFLSFANNLAPDDGNRAYDVFVHNRLTGVTKCVSINQQAIPGNYKSRSLSLSGDGRHVAFESAATDLISNDLNFAWDIFVRDRWDFPPLDSILLIGPETASVEAPLTLSWSNAPPRSGYALLYSDNLNGSIFGEQRFDIGGPLTFLATGANSMNGTGSYQSPPVPARAAGHTYYFEVAAMGPGGIMHDSNALAVNFF